MVTCAAVLAWISNVFQVRAAPCKCLYEGTTIPAEAAKDAGNPLYGTSCDHAWDGFPGTAYYKNDTECPESQKCEKGCNFLQLEWCYIDPDCEGASSFPTTLPGAGSLAYSYDVCGNPYCWNDFGGWDEGCPGSADCNEDACKCKFEGTTLPEAAATASGNPLYGTSCEFAWDGMPGTNYYKDTTECPPDKGCEKGCNFLHLEWCYVERGCTGASYFDTTLEGVGDLSYSYDVCGNPYCWADYGGWDEGCPGSDACVETTCGAVREAYKEKGCCGNPSKTVMMTR